MNKMPCQYAIVRFTPFIETGEFANVGIVLFAPRQSTLLFKLVIRRHGRITQFFNELNPAVYRANVKILDEELSRIQTLLKEHATDSALAIFNHLIRPRETMLRFSERRVVLATGLQSKLDELFAFYVERNLATKEEYQEHVLERNLRDWLKEAGVGKLYREERIGDTNYSFKFPFVSDQNQNIKVIKPLFLGQDDLSRLVDHGAVWTARINKLKSFGFLPKKVLFTIDAPIQKIDYQEACEDITQELNEYGVITLPHHAQAKILQFAL